MKKAPHELNKCDSCDFETYYRTSLKNHIEAVHKDTKKFACKICDYTCNFECITRGGLHLHQKAVHLGIKLKCDKCNYEGTKEVNSKRHMESKHVESREERMEGHFHNKPNYEGVEPEEDFYDIPDLALLEPSVKNKGEESEVDEDDDEDCPEEDSDDVPDTWIHS